MTYYNVETVKWRSLGIVEYQRNFYKKLKKNFVVSLRDKYFLHFSAVKFNKYEWNEKKTFFSCFDIYFFVVSFSFVSVNYSAKLFRNNVRN